MIKLKTHLTLFVFRDSLTDMTLIMYACKAGASGVGSVDIACKITDYLIQLGADLEAK
jgi:CAP-Gly domain-containing linker protein 3/4